MANDKELKIKITGDATQLGAESKRAVAAMNEVKSAANSLLASFTGGIIGGGIAGAITGVVSLVATQIQEARKLVSEARNLEVGTKFLKGARMTGSILSDNENLIPSAIDRAAQVRSDAKSGDENAIAALERLGLTAQSIDGLSKEDLFDAIVRAFRAGPNNQSRQVGLADVFGLNEANQLLPFLIGGKGGKADLSQIIKNLGSDPLMALPFYAAGVKDQTRKELDANFRGDAEPISRAGVGNERTAEKMRLDNYQAALAVQRSQLTVEEQITALAKQRAETERKMNEETDSVKKMRLSADLIRLDAEKARLDQTKAVSSVTGGAVMQSFTPQADEFAQRGIFIGGQQRVPSILERQLLELQALVRETRETRQDNKDIWG
jgi:hypothetical protein